ncbi:hypothetical protein C3L33_01954, partial [Rhododendron williamsianum]
MAKSSEAVGWAARDPSGILSPGNGDDDVTVKVMYCGVCHSDLHTLKNEWGFTRYPIVPGHEIVGVVTEAGKNVEKFKVGDRVGVGVIVDSCRTCGYSDVMVVDQGYVLRFPDNLPPDAGAPLICAGITVYSPMQYYGMTEPGKHLGVVGLGGLGHLAVKFGKAFGLKVTLISTSPKKEDAMGTMDYIIDTVSAVHPLAPLLGLLKLNGKLVNLGLPDKPLELPMFPMCLGRKLVGGSNIGGIKETQEMLDFCAEHNIASEIELIRMDDINAAMERLAKSDVKYRFVIDVGNSSL